MEEKNFVSQEKLHQEFTEYRKFAFGKNLFAMALALILATSMQKFVTTISETTIMPLINYSISATGGNWRSLIFVPAEGLEFEIGKFSAGFLEFFLTTSILYIVYKNIVKKIDPEAKITKD